MRFPTSMHLVWGSGYRACGVWSGVWGLGFRNVQRFRGGLVFNRNMQRFRGGLVFRAHVLNSRLESHKKEEKEGEGYWVTGWTRSDIGQRATALLTQLVTSNRPIQVATSNRPSHLTGPQIYTCIYIYLYTYVYIYIYKYIYIFRSGEAATGVHYQDHLCAYHSPGLWSGVWGLWSGVWGAGSRGHRSDLLSGHRSE